MLESTTSRDKSGPFLRNCPWGAGVHKGPFGNDRRDQQIVGYAFNIYY